MKLAINNDVDRIKDNCRIALEGNYNLIIIVRLIERNLEVLKEVPNILEEIEQLRNEVVSLKNEIASLNKTTDSLIIKGNEL